MGTIERYHPDVVVHLEKDCHVAGGLKQLNVVVVAAGKHRGSGAEAEDAALGETAILRIVPSDAVGPGSHRTPARGAMSLLPLLRLGRDRRNLAVRGIHDDRRLRQSLGPRAIGPGLLAVPAGVARSTPLVVPDRLVTKPLSELSSLFRRERGFTRELFGPLQRREGPVVPDALEIRIAPGRPRYCRPAGSLS